MVTNTDAVTNLAKPIHTRRCIKLKRLRGRFGIHVINSDMHGESDMKYLCKKCCDMDEISFCGIADNRAGRKSCSACGDNDDWKLHIVDDDDECEFETTVSEGY